ncbi:MAG: radical SAM protein [Proteobacteria bacterium]|nr:radical SAM protein [Pseudomonadota bacterium]
MKELLNIHSVIEASRVNGPGTRFVVFTQGCKLKCEGCFNTELHPFDGGTKVSTSKLLSQYNLKKAEGITVSGGEPFEQPRALASLLKEAKEKYNLTSVVYSGYTYAELLKESNTREALEFIDVLIAGRFNQENLESTLLARGSTNQSFIFLSSRYSLKDFYMPGKVEISISPDGAVTSTGFSNPGFRVKEAV